jgi:hypothetical protein
MRRLLVSLSALAALAATGCSDHSSGRIDNVVRVFMHDANHYSVIYRNGDQLATKDFRFSPDTKILTDAPKDGPMWAEYTAVNENTSSARYNLTLHLHDPAELNGAGWDHGKSGKGTTVIVAP